MPYFDIVVKDIGPVTVANAPSTDRLLIIGPSLDGPSNQVTRVLTQNHAESIFGPLTYSGIYQNPDTDEVDGTFTYNELIRAYAEALKTGANNIYLCRVGGQRASAAIGATTGITLVAENPGYVYNLASGSMTSNGTTGSLTIYQPASRGGNVTFNYDNTMTLGQLIQTVNSDNRVGMVRLYQSASTNPFGLAITVSGSAQLAGGTNGTEAPGDDNYNGKFSMYQALIASETGTFDSIEDFETDLVLLAGIYADDQVVTGSGATTTSIIDKFSRFCAQESREHLTHGFIGLRPLGLDRSDPDRVHTHISNYWEDTSAGYVDQNKKWLKFGYFRNAGVVDTDTATGVLTDYTAHISVVAGPDVRASLPALGPYQTNPVALYAGMVSALPSEQAATKQILPGTMGTTFSVREKQLRRLVNGVGFDETTKTNGKGSLVLLRTNERDLTTEVAYDVTFANDRRPAFADLQPQRVVGEAIRGIKIVLEPFLGDAFNANVHMAMEQQVKTVLDKMSEAGKLNDGGEGVGYLFSINGQNPLVMANNEVEVQLTLWPAQQIKRIRISTTVRRA